MGKREIMRGRLSRTEARFCVQYSFIVLNSVFLMDGKTRIPMNNYE
jgi:hypothetical protein